MTAGAADWMTRVESKILFKCPLHSFSVAVPERNRPVAKRLGVTLVVRTGCEKFYAQRKSKRLLGQPERRCDPSVRPAYDLRSDVVCRHTTCVRPAIRTTCDQTSFVVTYDLRSDVVCRHVRPASRTTCDQMHRCFCKGRNEIRPKFLCRIYGLLFSDPVRSKLNFWTMSSAAS
jgi:hypothetical protein